MKKKREGEEGGRSAGGGGGGGGGGELWEFTRTRCNGNGRAMEKFGADAHNLESRIESTT